MRSKRDHLGGAKHRAMTRACSRCGRIHPDGYRCQAWKVYAGGDERKLRNRNKWHEKARQIKEAAQSLCEVCRREGRYRYDNLEIHHIEKLTERPDLLLEDSNLVCLCQECHKAADAGKIAKDYLHSIAAQREQNTPPPC